MCILIVDDEFLIAMTVAEFLDDCGRQTMTAGSASEARHLLRQHPGHFTCLVTDHTMPGETGVALIEHVRGVYPAIPIVLATAMKNAVSTEWRSQHAVELVEKPFSSSALVATLERLLDSG